MGNCILLSAFLLNFFIENDQQLLYNGDQFFTLIKLIKILFQSCGIYLIDSGFKFSYLMYVSQLIQLIYIYIYKNINIYETFFYLIYKHILYYCLFFCYR